MLFQVHQAHLFDLFQQLIQFAWFKLQAAAAFQRLQNRLRRPALVAALALAALQIAGEVKHLLVLHSNVQCPC